MHSPEYIDAIRLHLPEFGRNAGHGHIWRRPDRKTTRCGGPTMCQKCNADLSRLHAAERKILDGGQVRNEGWVTWDAALIDGIWCVGMAGNLDTRHDATLQITGGFLGEEAAKALALQLVTDHNSRRPG